jgi:peptidylprolyl isomerase
VLPLVLLALAACNLDTSPNVPPPIDPAQDAWASSLGVDFTKLTKLNSGVYIQDVLVGSGDAAAKGDSIAVNYTGYLTNATIFDTNSGQAPAEFGLDHLITGWQEGVPGMRVGGKRKLVIPSSLAFGSSGVVGRVPGNANVLFDVELVKIF